MLESDQLSLCRQDEGLKKLIKRNYLPNYLPNFFLPTGENFDVWKFASRKLTEGITAQVWVICYSFYNLKKAVRLVFKLNIF